MFISGKTFWTLSNVSVSKYKSDNAATNSVVPLTPVYKPCVGPANVWNNLLSFILVLAMSPAASWRYMASYWLPPRYLKSENLFKSSLSAISLNEKTDLSK